MQFDNNTNITDGYIQSLPREIRLYLFIFSWDCAFGSGGGGCWCSHYYLVNSDTVKLLLFHSYIFRSSTNNVKCSTLLSWYVLPSLKVHSLRPECFLFIVSVFFIYISSGVFRWSSLYRFNLYKFYSSSRDFFIYISSGNQGIKFTEWRRIFL